MEHLESQSVLEPKVALTNNMFISNGAHILYTFSDLEKYVENAVSFLSAGLKEGQHVLLIDRARHYEMILTKLEDIGLGHEKSNIFFFDSYEFFLYDESFRLNRIMENVNEILEKYMVKGKMIRSWGHPEWANEISLLEKVKHFECKCDPLVSEYNILSVCAYNSHRLSSFDQQELLQTHEYLMTDQTLTRSVFYQKSKLAFSSITRDENLKEENDDLYDSLQLQKDRYKFLSEHSHDLITKRTIEGKYTFVSKSSKELLGYEPDELIGEYYQSFIYLEDYRRIMKTFSLDHKETLNYTYRMRAKDGAYVWLRSNINIIRNDDRNPIEIVVSAKDITSEMQLKHNLYRSREKYQTEKSFYKAFMEQLPDPVFIKEKGKFIYVNPAGAMLLETKQEQLIDMYVDDVLHRDARQDWEGPNIENEQLKERKLVTMKGNLIEVEVRSIPFYFDGKKTVLSIIRDMTERNINQKLALKSEKLSVAGQLAAGIAHEIRNPLTSIKGFLQLLKADGFQSKHYYSIMEDEIDRIETISSELLVLGKPTSTIFKRQNIIPLITDIKTLLETQAIIKNIGIVMNFHEEEVIVNCNETQIKQLFINLIKNAIEAMDKGGTIQLRGTVKAEFLIIEIEDEGSGISERIANRLGEPFYTTKEKGTGLGLMVCFNIVEQHQGSISVDSLPNKGTTFEIKLPIDQ